MTVAGQAAGQQDADELRGLNFTKLSSSTNHEKKWSTERWKNSSIDDFTFLKSFFVAGASKTIFIPIARSKRKSQYFENAEQLYEKFFCNKPDVNGKITVIVADLIQIIASEEYNYKY